MSFPLVFPLPGSSQHGNAILERLLLVLNAEWQRLANALPHGHRSCRKPVKHLLQTWPVVESLASFACLEFHGDDFEEWYTWDDVNAMKDKFVWLKQQLGQSPPGQYVNLVVNHTFQENEEEQFHWYCLLRTEVFRFVAWSGAVENSVEADIWCQRLRAKVQGAELADLISYSHFESLMDML